MGWDVPLGSLSLQKRVDCFRVWCARVARCSFLVFIGRRGRRARLKATSCEYSRLGEILEKKQCFEMEKSACVCAEVREWLMCKFNCTYMLWLSAARSTYRREPWARHTVASWVKEEEWGSYRLGILSPLNCWEAAENHTDLLMEGLVFDIPSPIDACGGGTAFVQRTGSNVIDFLGVCVRARANRDGMFVRCLCVNGDESIMPCDALCLVLNVAPLAFAFVSFLLRRAVQRAEGEDNKLIRATDLPSSHNPLCHPLLVLISLLWQTGEQQHEHLSFLAVSLSSFRSWSLFIYTLYPGVPNSPLAQTCQLTSCQQKERLPLFNTWMLLFSCLSLIFPAQGPAIRNDLSFE